MRRPDFLDEAAAVVRAPRWYRPAPPALTVLRIALARDGARRPAAAGDPGDFWRATGPAERAAPRVCPRQAATSELDRAQAAAAAAGDPSP